MAGWAKDQGVEGNDLITFMGDPSGALTQSLDVVLDHPGPMSVLGGPRCKRFALYAEDGVVKAINVSEGPDDPAGDEDPSASCAPAMINVIKQLEPLGKTEL
mmetsp:Transcript_4282/g.7178  ORF Transcript_4282/g.7178 Transcript_4282/m.7178 type:complete len:102 (-) Transcript_4282:282-587(-)